MKALFAGLLVALCAAPAQAANPVANPDSVVFDLEPGSWLVDVLANDLHPDGIALSVELQGDGQPLDPEGNPVGWLEGPRWDGSLTYHLDQPTGQEVASFDYLVRDQRGRASAIVSVCLGACGVKKITAAATPDTYFVPVGVPTVLDVLDNDDGDGLTIVDWTSTALGSLSLGPGQAFTYTGSTVGQDSFSYTVRDDAGGESSALVQITITGSGPGPGPVRTMGWAGTVSGVTHTPVEVDFPIVFDNPVAIVQPITDFGLDASVARILEIHRDGMTLKIDEAPPADGGHTGEVVSVLVVEQGRWRIGTDVVLEANTLNLTDTALPGQAGRQVTFSQPLPTTGGVPVVLTDVQTGNSTSWVSTRQDQVTGTGFRAFLQRGKGETQPHPAVETLGWVAISRGAGPWEGGADYASGRAACSGGGGLSCTVGFGHAFAATPVVVASISTLAEADAALLRRSGTTFTSTTLVMSEPLVGMADTIDHPSEQLSWLAVDPGLLAGEPLDLPPVAEDVGPIQTVAGADSFLIGPRGSDPEGGEIFFFNWTDPPLGGTLALIGPGFALEYFPPDDTPGGQPAVDRFDFVIQDASGFHSQWAATTILIDPPPVTNQPPTPAGDQVTVYEGECATIESTDLLLNDTDPEGDALLFDGVTVNPSHGQLAITSLSPLRATYRYCPFAGYVGTDSFVYQVEDEGGLTAEATVSITVLDDLPPEAVLPLPLCSGMSCAFDGSASTDDLGIEVYTWSFGDGTGADGPTPIHDFPGPGTYLIALTVTDTGGQTGSASVELVFDAPPVAAFDATCTGLACQFDAGASTDDLGIAGYSWGFGDGTSGSGQAPSHQYAASGTYLVTLTVTDTAGQPASASLEITLDLPPTAVFTVACDGLACRFDAGGSSDDTGIAGYAWGFGDGTTGAGEVVDHEFGEEREYTVTLTVTDDAGQTDAASAVAAPRDELTLMLVILR